MASLSQYFILYLCENPRCMETTSFHIQARELSALYKITGGSGFSLSQVDPDDKGGTDSGLKEKAKEFLKSGLDEMQQLQDKLYAQDRYSLLLIFQAMDAAGKDGVIKHVMSGVNPQGCQVASFKAPSAEELDHDFLWRCNRHLPERGRIGIFNRSYYEEVLVVKVHPEYLIRQRLPGSDHGETFWQKRYRDIRNHEQFLSENGTIIRKFFLYVSKEEQKKRFLERIESPEKNWKFSAGDVAERSFWNEYMKAYETMIRETSTPECPWFVVPADHKWFTRMVVSAAIIETLESLNLSYPEVDEKKKQELEEAGRGLKNEE